MIVYTLVLSLLAAIKYIEPGTDMQGYMGEYENVSSQSFRYLLERYPDNPGYYVISKLFSFSGLSYHFWFAFVGAVFWGSMMQIIYRFSNDRLYCMLLSFTISIFDFSLRGSKQTLAMGFVFLAFLAFADKKYFRSAILYIAGYFCHPSCLVFLACPVLFKLSSKKNFGLVLLLGSAVVLLFSSVLLSFGLSIIGSDHYTDLYLIRRSQYSNTTLIYYVIIFLFGIIGSSNYIHNYFPYGRFFMGLSLCCVIVQSMSLINKDFFRLAYYYVPFLIIYPTITFSNALNSNSLKNIMMAITIFYCLYIIRDSGYIFMWQY